MPIADMSLQAALFAQMSELYEKRGKLESDIRALDALSKHRIEMAALDDIDAYRSLQLLSSKPA